MARFARHLSEIRPDSAGISGRIIRQVSPRSEKIEAFFEQLTEMDTEFIAILEVCGFNDWLIETLHKWNCREIVLIHPEKPSLFW